MKEIQATYVLIENKEPTIITYLETHKQLFLIQEKYKFFYLNLFELVTNNQEIRQRHSQIRINERSTAKQIFKEYMRAGVLKKNIDDEQIERLISVGQILNNFWPVDSEMSPKLEGAARLSHYMKICCGLLEPHLEPNSRKEYHHYFAELEK